MTIDHAIPFLTGWWIAALMGSERGPTPSEGEMFRKCADEFRRLKAIEEKAKGEGK